MYHQKKTRASEHGNASFIQVLYKMVGPPGLEPGTPSLKGWRSNQLS